MIAFSETISGVLTSAVFSNWAKNRALKSTGAVGVNTFVSGLLLEAPMLLVKNSFYWMIGYTGARSGNVECSKNV